ncbi:hypothetical protein [Flavobacterium supellecticarium]|nr:hypothetical protein [Flavobacterium supellecticarium]
MSRQNEENRKKHSKKINEKRLREQRSESDRKAKLKLILQKFNSDTNAD